MTEVTIFQPGPPPFGYKQGKYDTWVEVPEEQMIIGYIDQAHKDGVSLRKIAAGVESNYGRRMTHAGVDKILKRRQSNDISPILRGAPRPSLYAPMPQFKKGIQVTETYENRQQSLETPKTKIELDDVFFNVRNLIENSVMEVGPEAVQTMLLRIAMGLERITDNIHCWDDSLLKTIEGSYQHARARQAYLNESKPAPKAPAGVMESLKPGDVVEFDQSKWHKCGGWDYGRYCQRFTQDPKAAGWHQSDIHDDEWECESCWQRGFTHTWADFKKGKLTIRVNNGEDAIEKDFKPKDIDAKLKDLKAIKKPSDEVKREIKFWTGLQKSLANCGLGGGSSLGREKGENELVYRIVGFDPATLPPIPPTISL